MDLIIDILKKLATTLSPTEFLLVLGLIALVIFYSAKFVMKRKNGIVSALVGPDETMLNAITAIKTSVDDRFSALETSHSLAHEKIIEVVREIKDDSNEQAERLRKQITDILLLRKDIESAFTAVEKQLDGMIQFSKVTVSHDSQVHDALKESLQRIQENLARLNNQLEKIDTIIGAMIPEFRSYHKELGKEIGELSRDVALVERSIQTQINTVNAVKLR